jgi:hypothetical protein
VTSRACLLALLLCTGAGCKASGKLNTGTPGQSRADALGPDDKGSGGERCSAGVPGREVSEYDTSGDEVPDVRKVYLSIGVGVEARLVMICRETDINSDGKKDIIRYYDDQGRSLREESDRDFDGKMDMALIFQDGVVMRKELDENRDGTIDAKIYFEKGEPFRAERDSAGRSTPTQWRPDTWEYFEEGQMVRMGIDLDGDARVDRWDRDLEFRRKQKEQEAAELEQEYREEQED